jgi:hypothetical protein
MNNMHYVGLDIHKKTISYCVRQSDGTILQENTIAATRPTLDTWMRQLPQPWTAGMEATMFTRRMRRCAVSRRYPLLRKIYSESPNSSIFSDGWRRRIGRRLLFLQLLCFPTRAQRLAGRAFNDFPLLLDRLKKLCFIAR